MASFVHAQVGALKNISEYPKARRGIDKYIHASHANEAFADMLNKPLYDHKDWPASNRCVCHPPLVNPLL